jgi:hypothetical protein
MKKEAPVKKEVKDEPEEMPAPEEDERPWWVKERELLNAARHPDDLEDTPGLHVLQARSYSEARATAWLVHDSGNVFDLIKDDVEVKEY